MQFACSIQADQLGRCHMCVMLALIATGKHCSDQCPGRVRLHVWSSPEAAGAN